MKVKDYQFDNLGEFVDFCLKNKINTDIPLSLLYENLKLYGELELEVKNVCGN